MAHAGTAQRSASPARRGSPLAPIRWDRVGRVALLGTLAVILLLYIPPLVHWMEQRSTAAHTRSELKALQREHDRLASQLSQLSSPAGLERAARRLGMIRSSERAYVVTTP